MDAKRKVVTLEVIMKWSGKNQKWLMHRNGYFVYDFWDCENFNRVFEGLDKKKATKYRMSIERIK